MSEGLICTICSWSRTGENPMSGILERVQETWTMEKPKRARKAETPKRPSLHLRSSAPALYSTPFHGPDISWAEEWKEFITAIKEKREPLGNGQDGLEANRMIAAIYQSAAENRPVRIDVK